jgi:hypothetical protein
VAARRTQPRNPPGSVLVPLKPVPRFRVLTAIERNLQREASELLRIARQNIRQILENAPLDPVDEVLLARSAGLEDGALLGRPRDPGHDPFKLAKERPEEARGLALATHELRAEHGAPVRAGGILPEAVVDRVLAQLPFRSGVLRTERARAMVPKPRVRQEFTRGVMPLVDAIHFAQDVRAIRLRRSLTGERTSTPRVIRHEELGRQEWTVLEGAAEVLAALVCKLPALDVEVLEVPAVPAPGPDEPGTALEGHLRVAVSAAAPWTYRVPPAVEPVAKLARQITQRRFLDASGGRTTDEEAVARGAADAAELNRTRAWVAVYQVARAAGTEEAAATSRADRSPDVRRIASAARGLARLAAKKEAEAHEDRELMRLAKAEAHNLKLEMDLPLWSPEVDDPWGLWHEARRAPEGDLMPDEDIDEPGEVADLEPTPGEPGFGQVLESRRLWGVDAAPALMMPTCPEQPVEPVADPREPADREVPEVPVTEVVPAIEVGPTTAGSEDVA